MLSDITLTLDTKTGKLVSASADNVLVDQRAEHAGAGRCRVNRDTTKEDPAVAKVVNQYVTASAPLANQVIGNDRRAI